jgi:sugar O-acyltransferase (sialic acid O-acetyltransferase NeuD family)
MNNIILHGGGGHARVVVDSLLSGGTRISGIYDPIKTGELFGIPYLGPYDGTAEQEALLIIAIGDNELRKKLAEEAGHKFANAIHDSAIISSFSSIGVGNMILHGTIIQAKCVLGNHVILNTRAQIDHDCVIGDFVHVGPGSVLCGAVSAGEGSFIGAGSVVIPGITIGPWATVGAGAVVTRDVPPFGVAIGCPAKVVRFNSRG